MGEYADLWIEEYPICTWPEGEKSIVGKVFLVWSTCGNDVMNCFATEADAQRYIDEEG